MKKIWMIMAVTFVIIFCMTGCGEESDEFLDYVNGSAMSELIDLDNQAKDSYAIVVNVTDDETALQELNTNTTKLTKQAITKAVTLGNEIKGEKLKKVHNLFVSSLVNFQCGVELRVELLQSGETEQMIKVDEWIDKADADLDSYNKELEELANDRGCTLTTIK